MDVDGMNIIATNEIKSRILAQLSLNQTKHPFGVAVDWVFPYHPIISICPGECGKMKTNREIMGKNHENQILFYFLGSKLNSKQWV